MARLEGEALRKHLEHVWRDKPLYSSVHRTVWGFQDDGGREIDLPYPTRGTVAEPVRKKRKR